MTILGSGPPFIASAALSLYLLCWETLAQQQRPQMPKWLGEEGQELALELETAEVFFSDELCENREKLLAILKGKGEQGAQQLRARTLMDLGVCKFKKGDFETAKKRFENGIGEMNVANEEVLMKNPSNAQLVLLKQAATFMTKLEVTQAGIALRRCREVLERLAKQLVKQVHKESEKAGGQRLPPVEEFLKELPTHGEGGQFLSHFTQQIPMLRNTFQLSDIVDAEIGKLDSRMAVTDPSLKAKRLLLGVSKGQAKTGRLLYVSALTADAIATAQRSGVVNELESGGALKAFLQEAESLNKPLTLLQGPAESSGCKNLKKTCKALAKIPDVSSNVFGETRVLLPKGGKKLSLGACKTNANLVILVAAKEGAHIFVEDVAQQIDLEAMQPVIVDACRKASLEASDFVPVLSAEIWHPEFAAVERTTEIRARQKALGLSDDDVKVATNAVNVHARKNWEAYAKQWRTSSAMIEGLKQMLGAEVDAQKAQEEEAMAAQHKEEEAQDEIRQQNLAELERKRKERQKVAEEAERARMERNKKMEEERKNRDPWLNFPEVLEAEKNIAELKDARRGANAKLEFDLSTQLTKDISAAERALAKVVKKARKAYQKSGSIPAAQPQKEETSSDEKTPSEEKTASDEKTTSDEKTASDEKTSDGNSQLSDLQKQLDDVMRDKKEAVSQEDFLEAKRLKKKQDELMKKMQEL